MTITEPKRCVFGWDS